ncbi:MAG: hypothetical protein QGD94_03360, partial [Planctomycetia bacterium]|nr:hypothetical protein [Planctomycetia bacterium]
MARFDLLQGGGGALGGALSGAAAGSAIPGIGTAIGAIGGGLIGLLGGFRGETEFVDPPDWVIEALQSQRRVARADVKREAGRARADVGQAAVTSGLSATTVPIGARSEIGRVQLQELARIDANFAAALAGMVQPIISEGGPFDEALKLFGYAAGQKLSTKKDAPELGEKKDGKETPGVNPLDAEITTF